MKEGFHYTLPILAVLVLFFLRQFTSFETAMIVGVGVMLGYLVSLHSRQHK